VKYLALAAKLVVVGCAGYWLIRSDAGTLGLFGILLGSIAALVGQKRNQFSARSEP